MNDAANAYTPLGWIGKDTLGGIGWHAVGSGKTPVYGNFDGQLYAPQNLVLGLDNKIYVSDGSNNRIQVFNNAAASYATLGWIGKDTSGGSGWHAVGSGKTPISIGSTNRSQNSTSKFAYSNVSKKLYINNGSNSTLSGSKVIETKLEGANWNAYTTGSLNYMSGTNYYDEVTKTLFVIEYGSTLKVHAYKQDGTESITDTSSVPSVGGAVYDPATDYMYVTCGMASYIMKFKLSNPTDKVNLGTNGSGIGQFSSTPTGITLDPVTQYFYIADTGNNRIVKTKLDGNWTGWTTYGAAGSGVGQFSALSGIAYDNIEGDIYVSDSANKRIVKTKLDGAWTGWTTYGAAGNSGVGKFGSLGDIYYDNGDIIVMDNTNYQVVKTQMDGAGWTTSRLNNPEQVLLQSSNTASSARLEIDPFRSRVYFYPDYNSTNANRFVYVQSAVLNWSRDSWHAVSASYKQSTGELSLTVDGVTTTTTTSWTANPDYGSSFYIGSVPGGGYNTFNGLIDRLKVFNSYNDLVNPTNPTTLTSKSSSNGSILTVNNDHWYNYPNPYFEWTGASDNNGIDGYYVYFGTDANADPAETSGVATTNGLPYWTDLPNTTITGTMVSGSTYYLRVKTKDNFGNVTTWDPIVDSKIFEYKYDSTTPTSPISNYISVSPTGFSQAKNFTFSWPLTGSTNAASDTGTDDNPATGSGLGHYEYKINNEGSWTTISPGDTTASQIQVTEDSGTNIINKGSNTFMLRVVDKANNASTNVSQTTFLYDPDASRQAPQNLTVSPVTSKNSPSIANNFTISWSAPAVLPGNPAVTKYYYATNDNVLNDSSFNELGSNINSIGPSPYATKQGRNVIYITTKNESGIINYTACRLLAPFDPNSTDDSYDASNDGCARKFFYTNTPAPGYPTALKAADGSDRELKEYTVFLKWTAPTDKGTGFNGYKIYRSTDGINFDNSPINTIDGENAGTSYADSNLESKPYFYKILAKDMAGKISSDSNIVNITPTGKFTNPPIIKPDTLAVINKAYSAKVTWSTQDNDAKIVHKSKGIVSYSTNKEDLGNKTSEWAMDEKNANTLVDDHEVTITGLKPDGRKYYYQAVWTDEDGKEGKSPIGEFTTKDRPRAEEIKITYRTLNSVTLSYKTTVPVTTLVKYGVSKITLSEKASNQSGYATEHLLNITGLDHSSKYYYSITGQDEDANNIDLGITNEFETLTMPFISENKVLYDQDMEAPITTYRFSWKTNIPTTTMVYYSKNGEKKFSQTNAELTLNHDIIIPNLVDKSTYNFEITGFDENGNAVHHYIDNTKETSDPYTVSFSTPKDSRPPKLDNLTVEVRAAGAGQDQKAQLVISWETDEPSTSQVEYDEGLSPSADKTNQKTAKNYTYKYRSKADKILTTSHVVIISELQPSKLYHLRSVSLDESGNSGESFDTTVITGKVQKSVIDLITNSLQKSLGFLTRLSFFTTK